MIQGRSHWPATVGVIALVGSQVNGMFRTRERAQLEPAIVANDTKEDLHLNGLQAVEGTSTLRAILSSGDKGVSSFSSSGYSSETRNILYLDLENSRAHWLLPANDQLITFTEDVSSRSVQPDTPPIATVALVKAYSNHPETGTGRLLVLDPSAEIVRTVAERVTNVSGATLTRAGDLAIVYEQDRKYNVAILDPKTLNPRAIRQVTIIQR